MQTASLTHERAHWLYRAAAAPGQGDAPEVLRILKTRKPPNSRAGKNPKLKVQHTHTRSGHQSRHGTPTPGYYHFLLLCDRKPLKTIASRRTI
jgi:hypothetical protein